MRAATAWPFHLVSFVTWSFGVILLTLAERAHLTAERIRG